MFVELDTGGKPIPPDNAGLQITGQLERQDGKFVAAARSMTPVEAQDPYLTSWDY
ncbi:MAG TPA: hypothetical protein VKA24_10975 [Gaiellaceae bacterium]|nr:hypothetical protein [Gaiellaceae bacterium]